MAFDRSKYKAAKLSTIQNAQKEVRKVTGSSDGRVGFHTIEDGRNWFRVCPSHNDFTPYAPARTTMLQCEVDEYENGEKTGKKEVKNKKIFIATLHSGVDSEGKPKVSKDPVELYIDYVKDLADEKFGNTKDAKVEKDKFLFPINGGKSKGKWIGGIKPSTKYVCYAFDSDGKLGRLDLNPAWIKSMEKVSLEESADAADSLDLDVFSDPNEGYPLVITKGVENEKTVYTISAERPKKSESWDDFFERVALTDNQLKEWEEQKPLKDLFYEVYTERDFNFAVDGLERFDKENGYDIFSNPDFIDELEEISKMVPEDKKQEEKDVKAGKDIEKEFDKPRSRREAPKEEPKKEASKKEEPTETGEVKPLEMKRFLRKFIEENYGEDKELPELTHKELVAWYNLAKQDEELPFDEKEITPPATEDSKKEEENFEDPAGADVEANLARLRANRRNK